MYQLSQRPIIIEGDQVALGPLVEEDLEQFWFWVNDKEVTQYLSDNLFLNVFTRTMEEKWLKKVLEGTDLTLTFAILIKPEYKLIGVISLDRIDWRDRNAMLGVFIGDKSLWGRGLGSEAIILLLDYAFNILGLLKVSLHVLEYNKRAIRAYKKVGFSESGRLKKHKYRGGRFWDVIIMEIFAEEFKERYRSRVATKCSDLFMKK